MANFAWGQLAWGDAYWGGIGVDANVSVTGNKLDILAPSTNGWSIDAWGIDAWGGLTPQVNIIANANIVPVSIELQTATGSLSFTGDSFFTVTGNGLTLTLSDGAIVIGKGNINVTTNNLQTLVQSPSISADSLTESVIGNALSASVGNVDYKLDAVFSVDGSETQIGTGTVVIELPTIVPLLPGPQLSTQIGTVGFKLDANFTATASSLNINTGNIITKASAGIQPTGNVLTPSVGTLGFESRYYVTGSQVNSTTGTLQFSTQQNIQVTANNLTLGSGSLSITIWQPIITGDNQSWTPIATGDAQTWTPL